MREGVKILPVPDLADRAVCRVVALQLNNHSGIGFPERNEHYICESFPRCHFPDYRLAVQGINESQVDGALQGVFIVVAAVAGDMDMGDVQGFRDGVRISLESFGKQFL